MIRRSLLLTPVLVVALAAVPTPLPALQDDRADARRWYRAAMERRAELDREGAAELLRRSRHADWGFLPAHVALLQGFLEGPRLRADYAPSSSARTDGQEACLAAVARAPRGYPAGSVPALLRLERRNGSSPCSDYFIGLGMKGYAPRSAWIDARRVRLHRALSTYPGLTRARVHLAQALAREGRGSEAREVLREGLTLPSDALSRLKLQQERARLLEEEGATDRARALRLALATAVARDGRAGLRYRFPPRAVRVDGSLAPDTTRQRYRAGIARAAGSWRAELRALRGLGSLRSDRGDQRGAIRALDRAVELADSAGTHRMRVDVRRFRGRALMKAGKLPEAEDELREALELGRDVEDDYVLAEVYHNLAHVYESSGALARAAAVADTFIALSRPLTYAQPRMMSFRDAGMIRWKAGWRAAANAAFDSMVRVVDEQRRHRYWAGEYFERTGEYERALTYYRQGLEDRISERSLNLAGLTRVLMALGRPDSAEAYARIHDRAVQDQRDVPMVPGVVALQGRTAEAADSLWSWTRRQAIRGNLHGAVRGALETARLLLRDGRPGDAMAAAVDAQTWARRTNRTPELTRAIGLRGRALLDAGRPDSALTILEAASSLSRRYPVPGIAQRVDLDRGRALAAAGDREAALRAFDRAARAVETVSLDLQLEVHWAGYRGHHITPFDAAIDMILRAGSSLGPSWMERLLKWSERRKAAAFRNRARRDPAGQATSPYGIAELQGGLGPEEIRVDYLLGDGFAAALVVSEERAEVVQLEANADSVGELVRALRRPFDAVFTGRVDLARARFDPLAAHSLYRAVVAPILRAFPASRTLEIVPDGALHLVPFDALVTELSEEDDVPGYLEASFLIDHLETRRVPSPGFLPSPRRSVPRPHRVLAVAGDAPAAEPEVEAIQGSWPRGVVGAVRGSGATEAAVRAGAGDYDVLHLATHAEADDRDPLASHLRLAPGDGHDGYLHLREIADIPWGARLVVLSACRTEAGRLYAGSGLMSLARAFLGGGAGAVIATQWPVSASSAAAMSELHRGLARGLSRSAALRAAKQTLRSREETAHPFHWAGFTLVEGGRD